jgi:transposase
MNKSDMFREMYDSGMSVAEIARETGSHYSYVYGVIQRLCNKRGEEVRKERKASVSDTIRAMVDEGKTVGQIAKELNRNYSFVFSVVKKYKQRLETAKSGK